MLLIVDTSDLEEDEGSEDLEEVDDETEKVSTQLLKGRVVEDKEEPVGIGLKVMVSMMKGKEKGGREEDDSIVDSSDDEVHDPVQLVVEVKEVLTEKPVEMMELRTVVTGRTDLDAPTDLPDSVEKEGAEGVDHVMVNSGGKEAAVDEVVTADHEEEVEKKVAKVKGRNR